MTVAITPDELELFDALTAHAKRLWTKTLQLEGLNTDPKMFSAMLFKRLWSNHRGYVTLWLDGHQLESDIILRSGIETSICLAANYVLRDGFVHLMHGDAIFTLKGQIKMWRDEGATDMVQQCEDVLRDLQGRFPDDVRPARLAWSALAEIGEVSHLYGWHRMLSGVSSHVTGLSLLSGIEGVDDPGRGAELAPLQRKMHFLMMAGATLTGCLRHGGMLNDEQSCAETLALLDKLGDLSWDWPGVTRPRPQ